MASSLATALKQAVDEYIMALVISSYVLHY